MVTVLFSNLYSARITCVVCVTCHPFSRYLTHVCERGNVLGEAISKHDNERIAQLPDAQARDWSGVGMPYDVS